jgi:hypothetical protein
VGNTVERTKLERNRRKFCVDRVEQKSEVAAAALAVRRRVCWAIRASMGTMGRQIVLLFFQSVSSADEV